VQVEDIRPAYAAITVIEKALARYKKEKERLLAQAGRATRHSLPVGPKDSIDE
jgi:hypothetical protein